MQNYCNKLFTPLEAKSNIMGLSRPLIFAGLTFALLVILVILGGVLGTFLSRHDKQTEGNNDNPLAPSSTSQLAAINWTDSAGIYYHAVFYQAGSNDLIFSLWDSQFQTWNGSRIQDLIPSNSSTDIQALNGTALTAVVCAYPWIDEPWNYEFGISLFYLDQENNIQELSSRDVRGSYWEIGNLSNSSTAYTTNGAAQIAAWWSLCTSDCDGSIWLFYQDTAARIQLANSSDWTATPYQMVSSGVASGTGLGVAAVENESQGPTNGAAIYYENNSNDLVENYWDNYLWHQGQFLLQVSGTLPTVYHQLLTVTI